MTDPIYGGVSASLALLGDINIAEPDARAGFAGPNIIEQTIRQKLPKGFQRSEFLLEHGAIDMIVPRPGMRETLSSLLTKLMGQPATATTAEQELPEFQVDAIADKLPDTDALPEPDVAEEPTPSADDEAQPNAARGDEQ